MDSQKKFGLALGGGGARGISHIGAVRVLMNEGIRPDFIAGSSMGAMIASAYALGMDWDEMETLALSFDKKTAIRTLFDFGKFGQAMLKGDKVRNFLTGLFGEARFEDAKLPLAIVACDLLDGKETVINEGSLIDAIMASIAVPGIFPPVKIGERMMIDGGVVNPTPVDVVKEMGADVVLGIDLITKQMRGFQEAPSLIDTLSLTYEIIRNQAMEHKLKHCGNETLIVKPSKRDIIDSFKFYDNHEFIHAGEESMAQAMPELRALLGLAKK